MTAFASLNESTQLATDKIATSPVALALYRNLLAAFEGDATAVGAGVQLQTPAIAALAVTTAKIDNGAVRQGKLSTSTGSHTINVSPSAHGSQALTGGTYSWVTWGADQLSTGSIVFGGNNPAAGTVGFYNTDPSANINAYVDERYVQASPPYNLGNGDIAQFIFALVDGLGQFKALSVAGDPTWAYHGPTCIVPETVIDGRSFRRYRELNGVAFNEAIKDEAIALAFLRGEIEATFVEREITHDIKNADMNLFPHPWIGNDLTGLTVVMLDPVSPVVDRLALIAAEAGASFVRKELLARGLLKFGNVALDMQRKPAGVMPVSVSWK